MTHITNVISGEEKAWMELSGVSPADVCKRAGAAFDYNKNLYQVKCFNLLFSVDKEKKEILNLSAGGEIFLTRLAYFFRLSVLWYLVKAKDKMPSNNLVKPSGIKGGGIFFRGSHILPLDAAAKKYADDRKGFIAKGIALGGKEVRYGDASIELYPLPKIPVTLILWLEDEEWEPRFDLLFDETAAEQLPIDVLWSVAMMSVLVFL